MLNSFRYRLKAQAAGGQDASSNPTGPESTSAAYSNVSSALTPFPAPESSIPHSSQSVETGRSRTYGWGPKELHILFSGTSLEQQTSNQPQSAYSARSSTGRQAHSHSQSSPTGMDQQEYFSCTNTPENSKYTSATTDKCSSPAPEGDSTHSLLGLADMAPFVDQEISDGHSSADPYSEDEQLSVPTNSNYMAPWGVYALAWCKWPVQQHESKYGGGKMAIGSFIEEGHNFVSIGVSLSVEYHESSVSSSNAEPRFKFSTLMLSKKRAWTGLRRNTVSNIPK